MAERRTIESSIWDDEWFGTLEYFEQGLWIGLFSRMADDQGRFIDNPVVIRSRIYPYKDIPTELVEVALTIFADAEKILRYKVDGKAYIQILNWWEHQPMQWATPSKFPSPSTWTDRVRATIKGRYIEQNWPKKQASRTGEDDTPPGQSTLPPQVDTPPDPTNLDLNLNLKVNTSAPSPDQEEAVGIFTPFEQVWVEETKLPVLSGGPDKWFKGMEQIANRLKATPDDFRQGIREQMASPNNYNCNSPLSFVNATANVIARKNAKPPIRSNGNGRQRGNNIPSEVHG